MTSFSAREPFLTMLDFKNRPKGWGRLDGFRTFDWGKLLENIPHGFLKDGVDQGNKDGKYCY